jgi:hypothetical protein
LFQTVSNCYTILPLNTLKNSCSMLTRGPEIGFAAQFMARRWREQLNICEFDATVTGG